MKIEKWPIEKLKNWDKNPRGLKKEDFERLKKQIKKLGQYKPLIVNEEGIVLGGNMRLQALKSMKVKEVEVSVVKAETDQEKLEYALSDNDRVGYYEDEKLAELIINTPEIELDNYKVDLKEPVDLKKMLSEFSPIEPDIDEDLAKKLIKCPSCGHEFTGK